MNENNQNKKKFWEVNSTKTTFVIGLISGIAVFTVIGFFLVAGSLWQLKINGGDGQADKLVQEDEDEIVNDDSVNDNLRQPEPEMPTGEPFASFTDTAKPICKENGKPVVRLFSTSWCPHCVWIKETFDKVAKEYAQKKKIVAYHWQLDENDNTLTATKETQVPPEEMAIYQEFNPGGSIPTFVFGCRYYRIGNFYSQEGDAGLVKEEQDFRKVIEELLK